MTITSVPKLGSWNAHARSHWQVTRALTRPVTRYELSLALSPLPYSCSSINLCSADKSTFETFRTSTISDILALNTKLPAWEIDPLLLGNRRGAGMGSNH